MQLVSLKQVSFFKSEHDVLAKDVKNARRQKGKEMAAYQPMNSRNKCNCNSAVTDGGRIFSVLHPPLCVKVRNKYFKDPTQHSHFLFSPLTFHPGLCFREKLCMHKNCNQLQGLCCLHFINQTNKQKSHLSELCKIFISNLMAYKLTLLKVTVDPPNSLHRK